MSAKTIPLTALQYSDNRLAPQYSLPMNFFMGHPNVYKIPYRKSHTAGQLTGELLEFPEEMFPRTRLNPTNIATDAIWVVGHDENSFRK